jgi:hypothetical protein
MFDGQMDIEMAGKKLARNPMAAPQSTIHKHHDLTMHHEVGGRDNREKEKG